jgi:post-segregation antitoxin (ccd killing protein)
VSDTSSSGRVRINVTLSRDTYQQLKAETDIDMSEFVRNAIRVYHALRTEIKRGKHVYIGTADRVEKELVVP